MDMGCHQTVGPYLNMTLSAIIPQHFHVKRSVFIVKKHSGAVVTSLGNMMRVLGCYDAGYSWHMTFYEVVAFSTLIAGKCQLKIWEVSPYFLLFPFPQKQKILFKICRSVIHCMYHVVKHFLQHKP